MNADLPRAGNPSPAVHDRLGHWLAARRTALLALTLAVVLAALGYRIFLAEPSDAAWATCLWRDVPTSAANWLAMDSPEPGSGEPVPAELLKARLLGACATDLAPLHKQQGAPPDWRGLHAALAARYPGRIDEDRSDPRAFVCEVYFSHDAALRDVAEHDWGYGDFNTGPVVGRRSHYDPARHYGQTLNAGNSVRFCRLIGPDGRPGRDRFQRAPLPDRPAPNPGVPA